MATRLGEDEKNEKTIRILMKQAPNRRCINCNSLGPQYVCLNFWTFVCTTCSGIHRELQHRVKSVSMSKFTGQEVNSLQNGGNEHAKEIYFKNWDFQRQPLPDSNNVDKLRDFIKHAYVDKRFTGERLPPRGKEQQPDRNDSHENRRTESRSVDYRTDSRSPPYENRYDDRRSAAPRRSDVGYEDWRRDDRAAGRPDEKRSPGRYETDRNRHERGYNENRRFDERGRFDENSRYEERSNNDGDNRRSEDRFANERRRTENPPPLHRDYGSGGSSPPIRSVKEILGDDVPPLRVEEQGGHDTGRNGDKPLRAQDTQGQRFGSSSSLGSENGSASLKKNDLESLIDFSAEPEAPAPLGQADPFSVTAVQPSSTSSAVQSAPPNTGWASFDTFPAAAALPSVSGGAFADSSQKINGNGSGQWPAQWNSQQGVGGGPAHPLVGSTSDDWTSSLQAGPPVSSQGTPAALANPSADAWLGLGSAQQTISNDNTQSWNAFPMSTPPSNPASNPPSNPLVVQQPVTTVQESSGTKGVNNQRAAIPEDIFSFAYQGSGMPNMPAAGGPYSVSHYAPHGGAGFQGQATPFFQAPKSVNPFDIPGGTASLPAGNEFPSLSSLQTALPSFSMGHASMPPQGMGGLQSTLPSFSMGPTSMPVQGGGLGPQWSQPSPLASQPMPYAPLASAGGVPFMSQPNAMPSNMQGGFMRPMAGANFGVSDSMFPNQATPQNMNRGLGSDAFFNAQRGGSGLPSHPSLMGPTGGFQWGAMDPTPGTQFGGQHYPSPALNSGGNMQQFGSDPFRPFPGNMQQQQQQFPTQNSFGSVGGNPFG